MVASRAALAGIPFSTALAMVIRQALDAEQQQLLEAALALDADESLDLSRAAAPAAIDALERLEW